MFRLTLSASIALALAGCATAPLPDLSTGPSAPATWSQPVAADDTAVFPSPDWWSAFGSPELERLIAQAHANSPDLAAAGHRIARARAQARAAGAGLLPSVSASGSSSANWRPEQDVGTSFRTAFDASYEVDVWGENRLAMQAAEAAVTGSEFDRQSVALSLTAEVATTYFQYLSLLDRIASAERTLAIAGQVYDLVATKERLGAASGLEVAQQRRTIAGLKADLPALERQRDQTVTALAGLLGLTTGELTLEPGSLDEIVLPKVAPGLPSEMLARRPDLRRAEASLVGAQADVGLARAAMLPNIRLTGGGGFSSEDLLSLFSPAGFASNLAAGLSAPLFDGGRLAAQRDASEARLAELIETYRGAVIAAFGDVENALATARYLADEEAAQRVVADEARRAYDLAEARYRAGTADFQSMLDAQRSLFQQEDVLRQTHLARLNAAVALFRALGGGW